MPERVLFRGQVVSSKLHRVGGLTQITLELEDYNRLLSMIQILPEVPGSRTPDGIPYSISYISESDTGPTGFNKYWNVRNGGPDADITTYVTADAASAGWSGTEEGDLGSFMAASAATTGGPIRYWVGWPDFYDPDNPGLYLHWQNVDPTDPTTIIASGTGTDDAPQRFVLGWPAFPVASGPQAVSPADLDYDTPNWTTTIMPTQMELSWDWASSRARVWVAGGTPHPVGSGYVFNTSIVGYSGTEIVNAPGSLEQADVDAIGTWHIQHDYSGFLRGSASIPAVHPYTGGPINGWRVGQVVRVSSLNNDLLYQPAIVSRPVAVTSVRGRLAGTGGGLRLFPGGRHDLDMAAHMTWKTFSVEEVLGSPGKATVTLELWENPPVELYVAPFAVGPLLDLWITTDDTDPIEWDLEFGDMPLGSLSREVALAKTEQPNKPIYRFHTEVDDPGIPVGGTTMVRAQCADISGASWSIAGVQTEWIIFQFEETSEQGCSRDPDTGLPTDGCATVGTGISVADPVSVTDDTGLATVTLSRSEGTTKTWWVEAVSLPVN